MAGRPKARISIASMVPRIANGPVEQAPERLQIVVLAPAGRAPS
jgi:hypothetical protein